MGLWNFLGGNKIGPGHPRYERELKKHNERQRLQLEDIITDIMMHGIQDTLNYQDEEDIINILKQYPNCPKFPNSINSKWIWGDDEDDINNWKQAQKWLKAKENPEQENTEYTKQLEQKIKDQEARIEKLEKQLSHEKE